MRTLTTKIIFLALFNLRCLSIKPPKSSLFEKKIGGDKECYSVVGNFTLLKLTTEVLLTLTKISLKIRSGLGPSPVEFYKSSRMAISHLFGQAISVLDR